MHQTLYPDIYGEGVKTTGGIQKDAMRHLFTHTLEILQIVRCFRSGPGQDMLSLEITTCYLTCSGQQVACAETQATGPEVFFFECRNHRRIGEGVATGLQGRTETVAKLEIDLPDLRNLLEGGTDKVGSTFKPGFPHTA